MGIDDALLIDGFEKARTEKPVHIDRRSDDSVGDASSSVLGSILLKCLATSAALMIPHILRGKSRCDLRRAWLAQYCLAHHEKWRALRWATLV
jgi:hypothetical protein